MLVRQTLITKWTLVGVTKSIPFSLSIPKEQFAIDEMDSQTFNAMMEEGYRQALNGEAKPISEVFEEIRKKL